MASSLPYNDDVDMTPDDNISNQTNDSRITDNSSQGNTPSLDPIPVNDTNTRIDDDWAIINNPNAGSEGETYNDTPPVEKPPLPAPVYKTVIRKVRTVINDYSLSYLTQLHDNGVKFYVVYTDGTENEVDYTEIYDPRQFQPVTYVNEALQIAEAINQHFWDDDSGAHVTDIEQDAWNTAVANSFNDLSDSKPYHNILMNSLGILLRRALYNLVSVSKSAIAFYDGLGNSATNILASFGRNGVQIGASNRKHLYMDEDGVAVYNADGSLSTFNAQNIQTDHIAIGNIQNSISDIATIRSNSQKVSDLSKSDIEATLSESRYIYISKSSGTQGVSKPTNKVTETGDVQNTWTLKRPTYDSNYPVLFISVQSVTAKGNAVFTTPAKDDTLTVIDGGHITTGTIDASRIAVDQISVGSLHDGADYVTKALALNNFQQVYISKSANTTEMSAPSVWITNAADVQNRWTTTKPTYNASYPNVFISRQTKTVDNSVASSIPYLDKSTDDAISAAATNASNTYATKTDAVEQVQEIYISKPNSTSSVSANTTWVTATTDTYNTWTTTRPSYNSSYPKVFRAKQTKKNDGTITCTTPTLDTSTTDAISTAAADATTKANAAAKTATDYITVIDNDGIKVHASNNPDKNYSRIDADGLNVIKNSISVAKFGETSRVGELLKGYIEIGTNSSDNGYIDMYNADALLCHIGYDAGTNADGGTSLAPYYNFGLRKSNTVIGNFSLSEGFQTEASGYASHAEGYQTTASEGYSHAEGYQTTASGSYSHAEGLASTASGVCSHAEGYGTTVSGSYSHAEGYQTTARGYRSHAEGDETTASGGYSHAEGYKTTASGGYSHAEGYQTTASGQYSHAEGYKTTASEGCSHASGANTIAGYNYQFVCGKYNSNLSTDLFEVGNGSSSTRSNAFRVTTSNTAYMGSTAVTSDKRIKTDLGKLDLRQAIDFIKELVPHKYEKFGRKELGFFAQDVEKDPNYGNILVEQYEDHGYKDFRSLSYDGLIAPIVSVEQNLITRVEHLEEENKQLKNQNEKLKDRLDNLESIIQQLIAK